MPVGQLYRHYRNHRIYREVARSLWEPSLPAKELWVVTYEDAETGRQYSRLASVFDEHVIGDSGQVPRFQPIDASTEGF